MVRRLDHLDGVGKLLDDEHATDAVELVADRCRAQIADIDRRLADVAGSVASLANAAESGKLHDELAQVAEETERLAAVAQAMRELNADDKP